MNKTDLAERVAERHGLAKTKARAIVDDIFSEITEALRSGDTVAIDKFGRFKPSQRAARKGRNPRTGKEINIAASTSAGFSAAKSLKDRLNG